MQHLKEGTLLQWGKYRIIRALGQGGFGITYEAEQVALKRRVAIKEFFMKDCCERENSTSQVTVGTGAQKELVNKFRGKFIREAQMIAGFSHPNVVRIIDIFEENETAYYVMENLPGGSLLQVIKSNGPLSESLAEKYIIQVANALVYIHSQKTIHLDVKPSNILLNAQGDAVLIDFGASKHYDNFGEQTTTSPIGFSKGYAPLEQYRDGDVSQFEPATDVYSLGATLYTFLTGTIPPDASLVAEDGLDRVPGISNRFWKAISESMKPRKTRLQNVPAFIKALTDVTSLNLSESVPLNEETTIVLHTPVIQELREWVDLGLSVKWATCNLGASCPSDYGHYFSWGETLDSKEYTWESYKFWKASFPGIFVDRHIFSKYNTNKHNGLVDNKVLLEPSDDAARVLWGGSWRMPTFSEYTELIAKCDWQWTEIEGVKGCLVTSKKNGNSIFLPAGGKRPYFYEEGYYWTSCLMEYDPHYAFYLRFDSQNQRVEGFKRCIGLLIRPVSKD